jgi:putative ABC transport system ATP-binding protein
VIRSRQLVFAFPGGPRIEFPDVDLPQGGQLLLLGPSGCGKSTWLALAAGLRRATQGDIEVAGQALRILRPLAVDAWRARTIGFLPQRMHLSQALDVLGNLALAYFAVELAPDQARIRTSLDALGLSALAARRPHELSEGQAQRVALARALLLSPKVILADEPTASLDDGAAAEALALLQDCATRCVASLVIATHDARVREALPGAVRVELSARHRGARAEAAS